jgi:hypothetical protein
MDEIEEDITKDGMDTRIQNGPRYLVTSPTYVEVLRAGFIFARSLLLFSFRCNLFREARISCT